MSTTDSEPKWVIEVECEGSKNSEFYSINSLVAINETLHLEVCGGSTIEFKRSGVRKILLMKAVSKAQG